MLANGRVQVLYTALFAIVFGLGCDKANAMVDDRLLSTPTAWQWQLDKTEAEVNAELAKGFRLVEMDVATASPLRLNIVLVRNTGSYQKTSWFDGSMTAEQIGPWLSARQARLMLLKPYVIPGIGVRYAAAAASNTGAELHPTSYYLNHTFMQIANGAVAARHRILDIEKFVLPSGEARYAAVTIANYAPYGSYGTATLAGWTGVEIANYLKANPGMRLTKLVRESPTRFLGIATQSTTAGRWMYLRVPQSQVNNLLGRFWARLVDLDRYYENGQYYCDVVMVDNGQGMTGQSRAGFEGIDHAIRSQMKRWGIPGGALAISRNGRLIYARGYGFQSIEQQELAQPNTVFRVGSVSKTITGIAMMRLIQQGTRLTNGNYLSLDTRIFRDVIFPHWRTVLSVWPVLDARYNEVTLRQVLQHTAGLPDSPNPMVSFGDVSKTPACQEIVLKQVHQFLVSWPGMVYRYANVGSCVAATAVEILTGQTYENYVRNTIRPMAAIPPSQMIASSDYAYLRGADEAAYYDYPLAPTVQARLVEMAGIQVPAPYGGIPLKPGTSCGGWALSPIALVRMASAIDGTRGTQILTPGYTALFETQPPPATMPNLSDYYGLHWGVRTDPRGHKFLTHNGGMPGTAARIAIDYNGVTFAYAFNSTDWPNTDAPDGERRSVEWDTFFALTAAIDQAKDAIDAVTTDLFPAYGYN